MDPDIDFEISRLVASQVPLPGQRDWFTRPYYDGKDHNLKDNPYCFACHDPTVSVSALKRCSRCQVAWYCGAECQKKHFKDHRAQCHQIAAGRLITEEASIPLRNFIDSGASDVMENYLGRDDAGFNGYEGMLAYLEARSNLAAMYWDAAYESEVKEVWERALFHCKETMQFDAAYDPPTRIRVPFILLCLNRDDEAYAYIRFWLKVEDYSDPVYDEGISWHGRSEGGDRPYPVEENCRYNDIFKDCTKLEELPLTSPYLLVLAIIKLRIIASHDAISRIVDFVFQSTDGKRVQEVKPIVQEMLVGCDITSQRQQLDRIFYRIERDQPSMLNDLLECEYMSERRQPLDLDEDFLDEYAFPVNIALANGLRTFYRVPGAGDILRQRY